MKPTQLRGLFCEKILAQVLRVITQNGKHRPVQGVAL